MNEKDLIQDVVDYAKVLEEDIVAAETALEWVKNSQKRLNEAKEALIRFRETRTFSEQVQDMMWDQHLARNDKN